MEEVCSPIVTPLMMCFRMRQKSLEIVDFFRNFTVEVTGVGDVCSFAQMDIRKHGNPTVCFLCTFLGWFANNMSALLPEVAKGQNFSWPGELKN